MGDFTGFTFDGWRSKDDLNIIRVSGGDRYEEELHPEITDRTAEVPGLDGNYYFGSNFGPKTIDIEIAFDSLTEEQFRNLRRIFGTRDIKELIFDERPYKYYMAKLESPIELSYVCFDEPKTELTTINGIRYKEDGQYKTEHSVMRVTNGIERRYKGEGKMTFICYFPFAKSKFKQLPDGEEESGWAVSSGILSASNYATYDIYLSPQGNGYPFIKVYNPGDVPTGFRMYIPFPVDHSTPQSSGSNEQEIIQEEEQIEEVAVDTSEVVLEYESIEGTGSVFLKLNTPEKKGNDVGYLIDTNNCLITGVSSFTNNVIVTSGNLYNEYVKSGYFFKLEPNKSTADNATIQIHNGSPGIQIFYDYLYF